ncbi:DUF4443 domain-containing protein [Candidatus Pacearchaeota archaeon]|nr:DUF4443 domain-containing protein [Candidatus Pacearchaeota archaeon]
MVGNIPNYTKIDVMRCFFRLNKKISRQELARELEMGEGTIRTILDLLKSRKLLASSKRGHLLSKKGMYALDEILRSISMPTPITTKRLYPQYKKIGVIVKNAPAFRKAYKLRDIAVKNDADGAVILKFQNRLYAPQAGAGQDFEELEKQFEFENGDALVIGFSDNKRNAENGALAIAIELSNALKKFIK